MTHRIDDDINEDEAVKEFLRTRERPTLTYEEVAELKTMAQSSKIIRRIIIPTVSAFLTIIAALWAIIDHIKVH